jgi:antitoxin component YwqK of YwqJK toxin-antitoxin module
MVKIIREYNYLDNKIILNKKYLHINRLRNGEYRSYCYRNGSLFNKCNYINNLLNGQLINYYIDRIVIFRCENEYDWFHKIY